MQFFILVILICLFIFLYCLYVLANDDFIFLRRDVSMEKIFNIIFLGSLVSLFASRLFYGFSHTGIFANPLVFLLFPYFPGLSLLGAVVGVGAVFLFLATRRKDKIPLGRLADFFSIAFLISLPVGFIGYFMFSEGGVLLINLISQAAAYFVLFIIFLKFFLPQLLNGKFKEGTITFIFLISFCLVTLISNAFPTIAVLDYFKNFENLILIVGFVASAFFLNRQEDLIVKIKEFRRKK